MTCGNFRECSVWWHTLIHHVAHSRVICITRWRTFRPFAPPDAQVRRRDDGPVDWAWRPLVIVALDDFADWNDETSGGAGRVEHPRLDGILDGPTSVAVPNAVRRQRQRQRAPCLRRVTVLAVLSVGQRSNPNVVGVPRVGRDRLPESQRVPRPHRCAHDAASRHWHAFGCGSSQTNVSGSPHASHGVPTGGSDATRYARSRHTPQTTGGCAVDTDA